MEKYFHFNTEKRKNAANDFDKDFLKLMTTSVYGKNNGKLTKKNQCKISE